MFSVLKTEEENNALFLAASIGRHTRFKDMSQERVDVQGNYV